MAAKLSLLKLPVIPPQQDQQIHAKSNSLFPSNPINNNKPLPLSNDSIVHHLKSVSLPLTALTLPFFLDSNNVLAVGGEFGLLEGRSFALIHTIVMGDLYFYTLYAGYLGWQWRRVRTIQTAINELKKELSLPVTPDDTPAEPPKPSPVDAKIQQLTEANLFF